jgi:cellulose synthase/poly-beta-1,6-N-acetylglucosamine synthase-like glycosyltransferase
MIYFEVLIFISGLIYIYYVENFRKGLKRLKNKLPDPDRKDLPELTVIIPARNEEKNISATLNSVLNQNYPQKLFKVIAVNDRSTDSTGEIIDKLSIINNNLTAIHIKEVSNSISPKKNAILSAVRMSGNEIIVTTDGDCIHSRNWLRSMVAPLIAPDSSNVGIVAGLTVFTKKYDSPFELFWQNMQNIDYISHSLIAAGSIGNGRAFTANGSNLLIRKELYEKEQNNLKNELASGDDFFMIQSARENNYGLRFVINNESIVKSIPVNNLTELVEQRSRWASKASYSSDYVLYFAITTFIFYSGILISFFLTVAGQMQLWIFLMFFLMKFLSETLFLSYGFGRVGLSFDLKYYIPLQIIHIPFNLFVAVKGKYFGFKWKGVKYRL